MDKLNFWTGPVVVLVQGQVLDSTCEGLSASRSSGQPL